MKREMERDYPLTDKVYTRDELIAVLRECGKRFNIPTLYLFGSYARGDATPESDVDVIYDGRNLRGLFESSNARLYLCDQLGKDVDWVPLDGFLQEMHEPYRASFVNAVMKDRVVIDVQ